MISSNSFDSTLLYNALVEELDQEIKKKKKTLKQQHLLD